MPIPFPPFDSELAGSLPAIAQQLPPTITLDVAKALRTAPPLVTPETLAEAGLESVEASIAASDGYEIDVTVVRPIGQCGGGPGILHTHGGGMVMGDRWTGTAWLLPVLVRHGAVMVTVDYRLAPEHPDPTPVEDCYTALAWTAEHAAELGIDAGRLLVAGASAGGGLAAGIALLARDRGGPSLCGQMLIYPMLDDRNDTISSQQIDGVGVWDRASNLMGWTALLGERRGGDQVSCYAAPARATDLAGLPPTYIDCGSSEVFRDEDVAFASGIWAAGGDAELHVWPGAFHGFEGLVPDATLARQAIEARNHWLDRLLAR